MFQNNSHSGDEEGDEEDFNEVMNVISLLKLLSMGAGKSTKNENFTFYKKKFNNFARV